MRKTFDIPFNYSLYNADVFVCSDTCVVKLSERDVRAVAQAMVETNGGHPVPLVDASTVADTVSDEIIGSQVMVKLPDLETFDGVLVELQEDMPAELVAAADGYISSKAADVRYYATVDGVRYDGTAPLGLPPEVFSRMVEAALMDHQGLTDFEFLSGYAPEAHALVLDWTREWAFKENLTRYGVKVDAVIREFPYQVYEQCGRA